VIRHTSKLLLEIFGTLVAGLALLVGLAVWRLSAGPITLDFLTPYIEQALSSPNGAYTLELDHTVLVWSRRDHTLDIRARGLRAVGAQGQLLAIIPEVSIHLSAAGLLHGVVAPTSLGLRGARLHLHREANGGFGLGFVDSTGQQSENTLLPAILEDLLLPQDPRHPITYLRRVIISDTDLAVEDSHWNTSWKTRLDRLVFARGPGGVHASATLELTIDGKVSNFDLDGLYEASTRMLSLDVAFHGFSPADLAGALPSLTPLARLALTIHGHVAARLAAGYTLDTLRFDLAGGHGHLDLHELYPNNVEVDQIEARGTFSQGGDRLDLEKFQIDLGGPKISISGTADGLGGDSTIGLNVGVTDLAVDELPRRWPVSIAPGPRNWITQNLSSGRIDELHANLAAHGRGLDPESLVLDGISGTMRLSGIDVHYLGRMPSVVGVDGEAHFDSKSFNIALRTGKVEGLSLDDGSVAITGLDEQDQQIAIELILRGPLQNALRLIDQDPLNYAKGIGLSPDDVRGATAVRLSLQFPLIKDLSLRQVQVAAAANVQDVTMKSILFDQDLSQGRLTLRVNKDGMDVAGKAAIGVMPVSLDWAETFGKSPQQRIRVSGELDEAARKTFDLATDDLVSGPVPFELDVRASDRRQKRVNASLDLTKAGLTIPRMGWRKEPGIPGKATLTLVMTGDKPTAIPDFSIEAADLDARGSADFAAGTGDFRSVTFDRLDFGLNRLRGRVARHAGGGYDIAVRGDSLDAAPWLKSSKAEEAKPAAAAKPGPPLFISLAVAKLWLAEEHRRPFSDAAGRIEHNGDHVTEAQIAANTFDGKTISISMSPAGAKTSLAIRSDDAGAVLQTLGISDNVVGGRLAVTATLDDANPEAPIPGLARITDYKLINAPFLAKLLTLTSLSGIVDRLSGQGISFSVFEVPFVKKGDVVELHDARTVGSDLGITFDGTMNFETDTLDINGTIVPVYTLNSLLGNIPLLGNILVGPKGSGVFAATYTAKGKIEDPQVSVNPLAALAPGILRSFMDILGGSGSGNPPQQAPEQIPPPSDLKN